MAPEVGAMPGDRETGAGPTGAIGATGVCSAGAKVMGASPEFTGTEFTGTVAEVIGPIVTTGGPTGWYV